VAVVPVAVENVSEDGAGFLLEQSRVICGGQTAVQLLFDLDLHSGAGLLALAPVENQLVALERCQQLLGHALDLLPFGVGQVGSRTGEQVVDGEQLVREALGQTALLLLIEALGEEQELLKERLHVQAAGVVLVDQLLKPLQPFGAGWIESRQLLDLCLDKRAQSLRLSAISALTQRITTELTP